MAKRPKAMTTRELIAKLVALDPEGNMPVALQDSGGQVKAISAVEVDELFVHPRDKTFATLGRYMDGKGFAGMDMQSRGNALYLD